jgi:hypothetical protein
MLTLRSHEGRDRRCRREGMVDGSMSEGEGAMRSQGRERGRDVLDLWAWPKFRNLVKNPLTAY